MRVLVVGDLAAVLTASVERLPRAGENFLLPGAALYASGVAANLAWNLRGLGFEVDIAGAVGGDALGEHVLGELERRGIGVGQVDRSSEVTGTFLILVDGAGERTMIGFRGAAERFPLDAAGLRETSPDWIHISGYTLLDPEMTERCEVLGDVAEDRGIPCSVDLEGIAHVGRVTTLDRLTAFCNLDEYRQYFGSDEVEPVERSAPLVVKAREEGCFLVEGGTVVACPVAGVRAVDSTGAGDAFNAGFIAGRLMGHDDLVACAWGNAAARMKVERPGPRVELSVDSIERLVERPGAGPA